MFLIQNFKQQPPWQTHTSSLTSKILMPLISKPFLSCAEQTASAVIPSAGSLVQLPLPSRVSYYSIHFPSAYTTGFRRACIISQIMKYGVCVSVSCFSSCFGVIYKRSHKYLFCYLETGKALPSACLSLIRCIKTPIILPSATTNLH